MIKGFFILNNQGKIRFFRFYDGTGHDKRDKIIKSLYKAVSQIQKNDSNFIEDDDIYDGTGTIIFRNYATLYFVVVIDKDESELAILDLI